MKPFVRQSHAGTFGRPVGLCHSHLLALACSPRNLQVAVAAMLVFIAVAGSAALHWTSTSSIDEFTRAVSPATAPLPSEPARLPASPPSQAADSAGPGAIPEAAAGRQQAPAVRYRVQLSWQRSQEAAVDDLLTRPDLQAKFPPLLGDPASVIREAGRNGPVSLDGFSNQSIAELEAEVAARHRALQGLTRDREPLQWAQAQFDLGNALSALGLREIGTAHLEEAVAAYREGLKEGTRDRVPIDWAATENNLGRSLIFLSMRESGTVQLEEAVAAFREALKERTRERKLRDWVVTENNLGHALTALGIRETGTGRLEEAAAALSDTLKDLSREHDSGFWAATTYRHGIALVCLAQRRKDAEMSKAAVQEMTDAAETMRAIGKSSLAAFFETMLIQLRETCDELR